MESSGEKSAGFALLGVPLDENSSFVRGASEAPPFIRSALDSAAANPWTESRVSVRAGGVMLDAGDVALSSGSEALSQIEEAVAQVLEQELPLISLGGDHSITYPIIRAFHRKFSKLSILHIDAHPDIYHEFQGNPYSHASPFARIMEAQLVGRLVQVGIRAMTGHQAAQVEKFGVEVVEMKDWRDEMVFEFDSPLYISLDIDGLDPAFAPGVAHPEPGGLSTRQVIGIIQTTRAPIVGADIVEYNPRLDPTGITAVLCAKLLKEIASRMMER